MPSQPLTEITHQIIHARLEDGTRVCIRPIVPDDGPLMREGIARLSEQSRYLRFFSGQPMPPDGVIERLLDADGERHIAWGAILSSDPEKPAIGAVHAVRTLAGDPSADFSVAIVDRYHGLGLARMLIAVLLVNCRLAGIVSLDVQILSENRSARQLVNSLGAQRHASEHSVTEYTLDTAGALAALRGEAGTRGLRDVFAALAGYF